MQRLLDLYNHSDPKLAGVLEVSFTDGTSWTFDVPKIHLGTAESVSRALTE